MSAKIKIVLLGMLAAMFLLPSLVQTSGARVVYLKATFRDSPGDPVNGILPDRIASDNKGPYQNASNVTVQFSEIGELQFIIGERANRRVNFLFNSFNWLPGQGPCAACTQVAGETWPDTSCTDPLLPDEPTTYVSFLTIISSSYRGPQLNFLGMKPGDKAAVRLRIYFETNARSFFRLRYFNSLDPEEGCVVGGPVMVEAKDTNNDSIVDRWILYPVPNSTDKALFYRDYTRRGNDWQQCSFGYFAMPFQLTLDRK